MTLDVTFDPHQQDVARVAISLFTLRDVTDVVRALRAVMLGHLGL